MEKLISCTDFVLADMYSREGMVKYANFLKQPLTLGMFVPCDLNGNVFEEPKNDKPTLNKEFGVEMEYDIVKMEEYQEAKERVLFEGFEVVKWDHGGDSYSIRKNNGTKEEIQVCYYKAVPDYFVWSFDTIEQLTTKNLVLTESAKKQIGL